MAKASSKKNVSKSPDMPFKKSSKSPGAELPAKADVSLTDLFTSGLKDMLWSENHLVKSLPKMIAAADDKKLKASLTEHRELTKKHASRLKEALESLGAQVIAKKCCAMEGLTISGENVIDSSIAGTEARDLGIIMSSLKVENFEITAYTGLIQLAGKLGKPRVADLLQKNLHDEEVAKEMLTEMSQQTPVDKSEIRDQKSEIKHPKSEVRNQERETRNRNEERKISNENEKPVTRNQ